MVRPRVLLLSNSTQHGRGYLDHAEAALRDFLGPARKVAFVPFAEFDLDAYAAKAASRLAALGCEVESLHRHPGALADSEAVFVGGGNTFRLLHRLYATGLLDQIRRAVAAGLPYVGSSAGSIVAGPTIKTTKDMPIVQPPSFDALSLVAFQISPHYLDPDPASRHMGETQEERILTFLQENDCAVIGLREGAWLRVEPGAATLQGGTARLFRRGAAPTELGPGPLPIEGC
jgi:dipeptidase E